MCYVGLGWVSTPKLITRNISPHDGWLRRWLFNVHIFPKKQLGKIETELTTSWKLIFLYLPFPSFNTLFPCGKYIFFFCGLNYACIKILCLGFIKVNGMFVEIYRGNFDTSRLWKIFSSSGHCFYTDMTMSTTAVPGGFFSCTMDPA